MERPIEIGPPDHLLPESPGHIRYAHNVPDGDTIPAVGSLDVVGSRRCVPLRILSRMTTPVPTRFTEEELALIDELVDEGVGESRSAVIRLGVHQLGDAVRRSRVGAAIAESYREHPQSTDDDELAMANAIALTEAEPW